MRLYLIIIASGCLLSCNNYTPQKHTSRIQENSTDLHRNIFTIISGKSATIGVAVKGFEEQEELYILADTPHFAMMSVCKFPQALALLHLADLGKYDTAKPIRFSRDDLKQRTGSSILKDHPEPSFSLTLKEVLGYAIGQSDNITANKIFQLEGGPKAVEAYVHSIGVNDIGIATDYGHVAANSYAGNWCTMRAIMQLLEKLYRGTLLSAGSKQMLWQAMTDGTSGPNRIKGLLPAGTPVAHKTGTAATDEKTGITPAFNDAGIVQLPNGHHFGIAVFIADSKETAQVNADIIAQISKVTWDYFVTKYR